MIFSLVALALFGIGLVTFGARLGRRAFLVGALPLAALVVWVATQLGDVTAGRPRTEHASWVGGLGLSVDLDEAIKMGDRIAILRERSEVAQFDTPERILAFPVDDFVSEFVGEGATLKGLNFERVADIELSADFPVIHASDSRDNAEQLLAASEEKWLLVLDNQDRPARWVNRSHLQRADKSLTELGRPVVATVEPQATLHDALNEMLRSNAGQACVVDGSGRFQGIIDILTLTDALRRMPTAARKHYDDQGSAAP